MQKSNEVMNQCVECGHDWLDLAGTRAERYKTGCPKCGSLYWRSRDPITVERVTIEPGPFDPGMIIIDEADDIWQEFHHGKD